MREVIDLLITALAAARLAWFVSRDTPGPFNACDDFRAWVIAKYGTGHWITEGVHCPVCLGFWFSALLWFMPRPLRLWLAVAEVARQLVRK